MKKNNLIRINLIAAIIALFSSVQSQNIGVGTTSPLSKLHIKGQVRVDTLLSGANSDSMITVDANGVLKRRNASFFNSNIYSNDGSLANNRSVFMGAMTLAFDTTTLFINPSTNRVGLGTNLPLETLDVRGNAQIGTNDTTNYLAFRGLTADGNGAYSHTFIGNRLYGGSDKSELVLYQGNDADNAGGPDRIRLMSGELRFQTSNVNVLTTSFSTIARDTNFVDRMIIKTDGKVGVGTTSPTERLDVTGNVKFSGALMPNNNSGSTGQVLTSAGPGLPPTWQNTTSTATIIGNTVNTSDISIISNSYLNRTITLPPGKWIVNIGMLTQDARNLNVTDGLWVRMTLSSSSTSNTLNTGVSYIGSSLVGFAIRQSPVQYMFGSGVVIIHNTTGSNQTLYLRTQTVDLYNTNNTVSYLSFYGSASENYLYAIPIN